MFRSMKFVCIRETTPFSSSRRTQVEEWNQVIPLVLERLDLMVCTRGPEVVQHADGIFLCNDAVYNALGFFHGY